jgi:hypothetical protein
MPGSYDSIWDHYEEKMMPAADLQFLNIILHPLYDWGNWFFYFRAIQLMHMKLSILLPSLLVLIVSFETAASDPKASDPVKVGIYIDGRSFDAIKDSVLISAKGPLMLGYLDPVTGDKTYRKFRVVIRRTTHAGFLPVLTYAIRYNDGEVIETIDIEKILQKTQVGDEILLVPVEKLAPGTCTFLNIVVAGDNC